MASQNSFSLGLTGSACSKVKRYESAVQIVRKEAVEKAPDGTTLQVDYELEWAAVIGKATEPVLPRYSRVE